MERDALIRANLQRGSNQTGVRNYNERLMLQLIRQHGTLTRAEATRATGLSPNAVSVIFRVLENEGFLIGGKPERGKIGQPSTPWRINPGARYYLGLKIGRRSYDLVVIDFAGNVRSSETEFHRFPTPENFRAFLKGAVGRVLRKAGLAKAAISGFGIAMPAELWSWTREFGAPSEIMQEWREIDVRAEAGRFGPWPVTVLNDGTAACTAELLFGRHTDKVDFIYLFAGTFIGGGIVLNSSIFSGRNDNAGGFGPLRVPGGEPGQDRLVDHASLQVLEDMAERAGVDPSRVATDPGFWDDHEDLASRWIAKAGLGLAHATVSALAVIDFEAVVIDGAFPPQVRAALVEAVDRELDGMDLQGVRRPVIEAGHLGAIARAVGAASAILYEDHAINQNTLMRVG